MKILTKETACAVQFQYHPISKLDAEKIKILSEKLYSEEIDNLYKWRDIWKEAVPIFKTNKSFIICSHCLSKTAIDDVSFKHLNIYTKEIQTLAIDCPLCHWEIGTKQLLINS